MKKKIKDEDLVLPFVDSDSSIYSRAKSVRSNRTFPLMSNQTPRSHRGFVHADPIIMPHLPPAPNKTLHFVSQSYIPEGAVDSQVSFFNSHSNGSKGEDGEGHQPNVRDGIFSKLMQLSNPGVERRHLQIGEEEYQYLIQLRRRMAKQLKDFYPYKSSETILANGAEGGRSPRSRTSMRGTTGLPHLSPRSPRKQTARVNSKQDGQNKNVNFTLPKF